MVAVLTLLSRRLPSRLRTNKDRSRWAHHHGWLRTTNCRCCKLAARVMFWCSSDLWTFSQSLARAARQTFQVEQSQFGKKILYRHGRGDRSIGIDLYINSRRCGSGAVAALSQYRDQTKNEHWPYTSRQESTTSCFVPSTSLQVNGRETLTPSSSGSVNRWTNVGTDVYRFPVAMPMLMWFFSRVPGGGCRKGSHSICCNRRTQPST